MKKLFLISATLIAFHFSVFGQCETEPTIEKRGKILLQKIVKPDFRSLVGLRIEANSAGTSWAKKGAESNVLSIFVDGKYNQDILLFAGAEKFAYQVLLGELKAGKHKIVITENKNRSVNTNSKVFSVVPKIYSLLSKKLPALDYVAMANSPFVYLRPNVVDNFSDIPLLIYYEIFNEPENITRILYTTIFTNEDGGTQSTALMSRWGRMTDIEWIYELKLREGEILSETYQAANHEVKDFRGTRIFGRNPLLFDVTNNNNFADKGCSELRFALLPVRADLSKGSRETMMDKFPWTYKIMAQEARREGRIDPENLGVNTIDDLRNYLFVETYAENQNSAVSIEVTDRNGNISTSDFDNPSLRVGRKGFFRIAVRIPAKEKLNEIAIRCWAANKESNVTCGNANILKILRLDDNFQPQEIQFERAEAKTLKPLQNKVFRFK